MWCRCSAVFSWPRSNDMLTPKPSQAMHCTRCASVSARQLHTRASLTQLLSHSLAHSVSLSLWAFSLYLCISKQCVASAALACTQMRFISKIEFIKKCFIRIAITATAASVGNNNCNSNCNCDCDCACNDYDCDCDCNCNGIVKIQRERKKKTRAKQTNQ